MNREKSLLQMLDAAVKVQYNISFILEAKALEAEKMRNWSVNHLSGATYDSHEDQLTVSLKLQEQLIELLEGINRMEAGLNKNLKALLHQSEENGFDQMMMDYDNGKG
ncbi:restriction endonuclease subunit S [Paenibacillus sp. GYB006]|uniref:restriction endonuclease subunit S n=1 Tax=Paenibacillus sp. GYB006 TaxID=2994394 RepID=UPI002F96356F